MTDFPSLTSAELADLKAKAKASHDTKAALLKAGNYIPENIYDAAIFAGGEFQIAANHETILRLIDTIERRDEQIERLRMALMPTFGPGRMVEYDQRQKKMNIAEVDFQIICEALAATEPHDE